MKIYLKHFLQFSKLVFTPVAIVFIAIMAVKNREIVFSLVEQSNLVLIVCAILLWTGMHFLSALVAALVFRSATPSISWGQAFYIHANRLPARYIPGGIWHTVGRVADYAAQGISAAHITLFIFLGNALAPCSTFFLGGLAMQASGFLPGYYGLMVSGAGLLGIVAIGMLARTRFIRINAPLEMTTYWAIIGMMLFYWIVAAFCFTLYFHSFPDMSMSWWKTGGTYLFSWGVGFLSFFAPQGIGVFETVSAKFLEAGISFGSTAVMVAGFRVVILLSDIVAFSSARLFFKRYKITNSVSAHSEPA